MNWTKEPWAKGQEINISGKALNISMLLGSSSAERVSEARDNLERIRDCVNAMAGIDDPAKFMDDVREILESVAEHDQMAEFCDFWPDEYFFECEGETHLTIGDIRLARALLSRMGGGE